MPTGGMLATMPEPSIAIFCIAGIGIEQADRPANGNTNSSVAIETDTSLDRSVIMFCNRILLSAEEIFCD